MRTPSTKYWSVVDSTHLALLAALLTLGATGCKEGPPAELPPPRVEVLTVTATKVPLTAEFIGQLDSPQNVEIRARVEAFVKEILFVEGMPVKEGDRLFALDKEPFEERLAAAEGMLAEAKAALKKYQADVARLTPLAEKKAIPLQDLDNAVASVAVGEASVQSAQAQVKSALLDLGYCDVQAPVSGLIGAKQVSVGSLVGKGEPTLLATISKLDPIWFYCAISEVDYLRAERQLRDTGRKLGDVPVRLILADGSEHSEVGKWVFLDRAVDATTGTLRARAEFDNPGAVLRPGMFARVRLSHTTERESILVPERAVAELQGKNFVWVIGPDDRATQRLVQVGPQKIGENLMIMEGLEIGERIVVEGLQKVREGALVEPMTAAQLVEAAQAAKQAAARAVKEAGSEHAKE
jgi:membrane fusion protein, multidrug efflux system